MTDLYPLRVRVAPNLWLRRALGPAFRGRFPSPLAKRLGVGQGPMEFMSRLIAHKGKDIRFVPAMRSADVALFVGIPAKEELDAAERHHVRVVLRLDGLGLDSPWIQGNPEKLHAVWEKTRFALQKAHGLIFQSKFAHRAFSNVFGPLPCPSIVIPNGFMPINSGISSQERSSGKTLLVAGRDVPRKRIGQMVACFCRSPFAHDYRLEVVGPTEMDESLQHPSVSLLGKLHPADLQRRLMVTRGLLHLDWYDWCPNLVGEAIMAGAPVMCGKIGGTPELVREFGLISDLGDPEPDFVHGPGKVPDIPQDRFNEALDIFLHKTHKYTNEARPDLYIDHVAEKYRNFLKQMA